MAEVPPPTPPKASEPPSASGGAEPPAAKDPEDWETRFKYLLADFENFRKRVVREQERARERARADVLRSLLPLHEAFVKARDAVRRHPATDPVRQGLDLLGREWEAFLAAEGVEPLARVGDRFRAEEHEAIAEAPVDGQHPEGTIVEIAQQGYAVRDGILRPAKVVVARRTPPSSHASSDAVETPGSESTR